MTYLKTFHKIADYDWNYGLSVIDQKAIKSTVIDKTVMGKTVIDKTVTEYPHLAKEGWCFATNCNKIMYNYDLELERELNADDIKKQEIRTLKLMAHMSPAQAKVMFEEKAYQSNGEEIDSLVPVFVRIKDRNFLAELGVSSLAKEYNRFEIMDLDE